MGALHASRPHDPSLLSDERARRAFGQCRYRPWPPKSELLLRLPLTLFPLEALTDRICRRDALVRWPLALTAAAAFAAFAAAAALSANVSVAASAAFAVGAFAAFATCKAITGTAVAGFHASESIAAIAAARRADRELLDLLELGTTRRLTLGGRLGLTLLLRLSARGLRRRRLRELLVPRPLPA